MASIAAVIWGVADLGRGVAFWSEALDYEPAWSSDIEVLLRPKSGSGVMLDIRLVRSDRPRRHHMDIAAPDLDDEVARLVALGATVVDDWSYEPDAGYVVLKDPDGNPFCVVASG